MLALTLAALLATASAQQQDPQLLNGGSALAMSGDSCVAVAVDKRFGSGPQLVNVGPRTVLAPTPRLLVAFTGMEGDVQSLSEELSAQVSAKAGRSSGFGFGGVGGCSIGRSISPTSMSALTSHVLYGRRRSPYYVETIVAGLERVVVEEGGEDEVGGGEITTSTSPLLSRDNDGTDSIDTGTPGLGNLPSDSALEKVRRRRRVVHHRPFLCAMDVIGAQSTSRSFVCSGAASKSMYGTAEAMWRPGLGPDDLARVCGQAFLSALERDCLSGYGATLYVISKDTIVEYDLACRND